MRLSVLQAMSAPAEAILSAVCQSMAVCLLGIALCSYCPEGVAVSWQVPKAAPRPVAVASKAAFWKRPWFVLFDHHGPDCLLKASWRKCALQTTPNSTDPKLAGSQQNVFS